MMMLLMMLMMTMLMMMLMLMLMLPMLPPPLLLAYHHANVAAQALHCRCFAPCTRSLLPSNVSLAHTPQNHTSRHDSVFAHQQVSPISTQ